MLAKNVKETAEIAKILLTEIVNNKNEKLGATIVGLSGDLGAGKTAFIQAVAKHLGINDKVISPTFVIMKKYTLRNSKDHKFLFHLDAYRLKNEKELLYLGWEEIIGDKNHLVFIEWPENVSKIMPAHSRFIYISTDKNGHRNLELR